MDPLKHPLTIPGTNFRVLSYDLNGDVTVVPTDGRPAVFDEDPEHMVDDSADGFASKMVAAGAEVDVYPNDSELSVWGRFLAIKKACAKGEHLSIYVTSWNSLIVSAMQSIDEAVRLIEPGYHVLKPTVTFFCPYPDSEKNNMPVMQALEILKFISAKENRAVSDYQLKAEKFLETFSGFCAALEVNNRSLNIWDRFLAAEKYAEAGRVWVVKPDSWHEILVSAMHTLDGMLSDVDMASQFPFMACRVGPAAKWSVSEGLRAMSKDQCMEILGFFWGCGERKSLFGTKAWHSDLLWSGWSSRRL